jgi:hypothetical protein
MTLRATCLVTVLLALAATVVAGGSQGLRTFDDDPAGHAPAWLTLAAMRQPAAGRWVVAREGRNGVLVHDADARAGGYAMAIAPGSLSNGVIAARLRLAGGDRTGGLVWAYADDQNFEALVLDLAHGTIAMYRMSGGNRIRLAFEDDLELDPDAWHALKVTIDGRRVRTAIGGVRVFSEDGRRGDGRTPAGRAGLLATGASTVAFDDLRVDARERHGS